MSRSCRACTKWALVLVSALAVGCQNYNFNPVNSCMLTTGVTQFTLSDISTADVLFVIDDSNSMSAEQNALSVNLGSYIAQLDAANQDRALSGLEPFDFHIAVTTSSVYWNQRGSEAAAATCRSDCGTASGTRVCCQNATSQPRLGPKRCSATADCTGGQGCNLDCNNLKGEKYCCSNSTKEPMLTQRIPCSLEGRACGSMQTHFGADLTGCGTAGVAVAGYPYARGDFVSLGTNPRVLHFDKSLYEGTGTNSQGFTSAELMNFFKQNVVVGTCGSGQEQALAGGRKALEKALAGQQMDTYSVTGIKQQGSYKAVWPHPKSQLVLVFLGDEDDCSSPEDPSGGVVFMDPDITPVSGAPGLDACVKDTAKLHTATQYVNYFLGTKRPVVAAFIESASKTQCGYDPDGDAGPLPPYPACEAGMCCQTNCPNPPPEYGYPNIPSGTCAGAPQNAGDTDYSGWPYYCGGQASGTRLFQTATQLEAEGAKVFKGSVCDGEFDKLLKKIGEMSIPPTGLALPSMPAASDITVLRIIGTDGQTTRRICGVPGAGAEWWFTSGKDSTTPIALGQYVYINPAGECKLNPGETYSAEYIGRLPEAGCMQDADCKTALGGNDASWTCYAGPGTGDGFCRLPTTTSVGTCICGSPEVNCPNGKN